jgi:zinc protease
VSAPLLDRTLVPPRGPLRPFHPATVHRRKLANGLTVLVAEQRKFPVVTVDLIVDAGGLAEPDERAGVAAMATSLLESGAGSLNAEEIAERVDGLGLSLDQGVS